MSKNRVHGLIINKSFTVKKRLQFYYWKIIDHKSANKSSTEFHYTTNSKVFSVGEQKETRFPSIYRKAAVRKVSLKSGGCGKVFVNKTYLECMNQIWRIQLEKPIRYFFEKFNIRIEVGGGGSRSQQKIVRPALRTVCFTLFPRTKKLFDAYHLVSQDVRKKERRKYGLKKARKRPQFSKR